ncbi:ATP-binding protein [Actinoallomurus vinaceus]
MERRLRKWGYSDISDDATLVATELVTNAMKATPGEAIRFLCRWEDGGVYVAVWDSSPERPAPTYASELTLDDLDLSEAGFDANGGRGLHIVDALALEWGYRPDPVDPRTGRSPGKWVWARVVADARSPEDGSARGSAIG